MVECSYCVYLYFFSGGADDLSAVVHTCPSVQESLGPALLHTYAAVDVVEGLDVDKEDFDKYGSRSRDVT